MEKEGKKNTHLRRGSYLQFMQILLRSSKLIATQIWPVCNFHWWPLFIFIHQYNNTKTYNTTQNFVTHTMYVRWRRLGDTDTVLSG